MIMKKWEVKKQSITLWLYLLFSLVFTCRNFTFWSSMSIPEVLGNESVVYCFYWFTKINTVGIKYYINFLCKIWWFDIDIPCNVITMQSSYHLSLCVVFTTFLAIFPFTGWVKKMKHLFQRNFPVSKGQWGSMKTPESMMIRFSS